MSEPQQTIEQRLTALETTVAKALSALETNASQREVWRRRAYVFGAVCAGAAAEFLRAVVDSQADVVRALIGG